MASLWSLLASVISIAAGASVFKHLMAATDDFAKPLIESCPAHVAENPILGFKPVDAFLCLIIPFFEKARLHPANYIAAGYLFAVAVPATSLLYIESSRKRAPMFLTWLPLIFLAMQVLGIGVTFPLIWIPAYILLNAGDRSSKIALEGKAIPLFRTAAIGLVSFAIVPALLCLGTLEGPLLTKFIIVFQFAPIVQPFLVWPFYGTTRNQTAGHRAVQFLYLFAGGIAFMWHSLAIALAANNPSLLFKTLELFSNREGYDSLTYFFLIDGLGVWISLLYFVLYEEGLPAFLITTVGSVLIGPAALALYFAYREGLIASAAAAANSKGSKKSQ